MDFRLRFNRGVDVGSLQGINGEDCSSEEWMCSVAIKCLACCTSDMRGVGIRTVCLAPRVVCRGQLVFGETV